MSYSYIKNLNREQWAWEFLRRNPEYRRDYTAFIRRWRALERDYGVIPNRDYQQWKIDPRALACESHNELLDNDAIACEQELIQIECWMGAKWGFYKFPLDPECSAPKVPDELLWREQLLDLDDNLPDDENSSFIKKIGFDLRLSLKDQLAAARVDLIAQSRQLQREYKLKLSISDHVVEWKSLLAALDDLDAGQIKVSEQQLKKAQLMCETGYKKILLMRG